MMVGSDVQGISGRWRGTHAKDVSASARTPAPAPVPAPTPVPASASAPVHLVWACLWLIDVAMCAVMCFGRCFGQALYCVLGVGFMNSVCGWWVYISVYQEAVCVGSMETWGSRSKGPDARSRKFNSPLCARTIFLHWLAVLVVGR